MQLVMRSSFVSISLVCIFGCGGQVATHDEPQNGGMEPSTRSDEPTPLTKKHQSAKSALESLGAQIGQQIHAGHSETYVDMDYEWKGGDSDLNLLGDLANVRVLYLGPNISITASVRIESLQNLRLIVVSQSRKSKDELQPIRKAFPAAEIYDDRDRV